MSKGTIESVTSGGGLMAARRLGLAALCLFATLATGRAGSADAYKATVTFLKGIARHQDAGGAISRARRS